MLMKSHTIIWVRWLPFKKGDKDGVKVMIAGHMDEVGFMVCDIDKDGYIKMLPVGGWWGHASSKPKL